MVLAFSKSPFWMESIRACTVSLLFIMFSFTAYPAISECMGLGINECSLWNILRFPPIDKHIVYKMPVSV
jgi:hypothetical protein